MFVKKARLIALALVLTFILPAAPAAGNGVQPLSTFDPNFETLDDGDGGLEDQGDGEVMVTGHTYAKHDADTIGVRMTLQRWTGSSWVDVYTTPDYTLSNEDYIYALKSYSVSQGYYYRVKTVHWTVHEGVREQGVRYTGSVGVE